MQSTFTAPSEIDTKLREGDESCQSSGQESRMHMEPVKESEDDHSDILTFLPESSKCKLAAY